MNCATDDDDDDDDVDDDDDDDDQNIVDIDNDELDIYSNLMFGIKFTKNIVVVLFKYHGVGKPVYRYFSDIPESTGIMVVRRDSTSNWL